MVMRQIKEFVKLRVNFLNDGALLVFVSFGKLKKNSYQFFIVNCGDASVNRTFGGIASKRVILRKFFSIARLLERCDKNGLVG